MSTVHSVHLTMRAVRLLELCEAEGFENIEGGGGHWRNWHDFHRGRNWSLASGRPRAGAKRSRRIAKAKWLCNRRHKRGHRGYADTIGIGSFSEPRSS